MDLVYFIGSLILSFFVASLILGIASLFVAEIPLVMIPILTIIIYTFWILFDFKIKREEKEEKENREKLKNYLLESQNTELQEKISNLSIELFAKLPDLKKNEESFYLLLDAISKEEEKLSDLKRRHPKIQSMIKTRKEGDSKSEEIKKVKNLLGKLKTKKVDPDSWNEGPKLDAQFDEE